MRELYHAARMRMLDFLVDLALPPREMDAIVRSLGTEDIAAFVEPVVSGVDNTVSLFRYDTPAIEASILETKFEGNTRAAEFLGCALYSFLYEFLAESAAFEPKPRSSSRFRFREEAFRAQV